MKWPKSKSLKGVSGFLSRYYRQFIKGYGKIVQPLTQLLKRENQGKFNWMSQAHRAFVNLKQALVTLPILATPGFSKKFIIECDASGTRLEAILMQEYRLIKEGIWLFSEGGRKGKK